MGHICKDCKTPLIEGNHNPNNSLKYNHICYTCINIRNKKRKARNPKATSIKNIRYKARYRARIKTGTVNPPIPRNNIVLPTIKVKSKDARNRNRFRVKLIVFNHYCDGDIKCKQCGFRDTRALSIDHINGNGAEHRKLGAGTGIRLCRWLIRNGLPDGFQILCMNCQFIKMFSNDGAANYLILEEPPELTVLQIPENFQETELTVKVDI